MQNHKIETQINNTFNCDQSKMKRDCTFPEKRCDAECMRRFVAARGQL